MALPAAAPVPVKSANLAPFAHDERVLRQRCQRLQAEMIAWMSGQRERPMNFDGTFTSLISIYQRDAESPYKKLKPSSRHPYDVYCRMLTVEIGARRINACGGRDARRWFKAWSEPTDAGGRPRIAAARMAMIVLKTALSFGKACRLPGCAEFKTTIEDIRFQGIACFDSGFGSAPDRRFTALCDAPSQARRLRFFHAPRSSMTIRCERGIGTRKSVVAVKKGLNRRHVAAPHEGIYFGQATHFK
jgi:hypothetical protein